MNGSLRYSELSHRIAGVSQKMLTQTLRNLERDGLLTRTVTPSVPVRTDYGSPRSAIPCSKRSATSKIGPRSTCPKWTTRGPTTTRNAG